MRSKVFRLSADAAADRRCFYYFLMAVIVIRHETAATARWTLPLIVRTFFNDTITVAVWTGFHVRHMLSHQMAVLFVVLLRLPRKPTFEVQHVRFGPKSKFTTSRKHVAGRLEATAGETAYWFRA